MLARGTRVAPVLWPSAANLPGQRRIHIILRHAASLEPETERAGLHRGSGADL